MFSKSRAHKISRFFLEAKRLTYFAIKILCLCVYIYDVHLSIHMCVCIYICYTHMYKYILLKETKSTIGVQNYLEAIGI